MSTAAHKWLIIVVTVLICICVSNGFSLGKDTESQIGIRAADISSNGGTVRIEFEIYNKTTEPVAVVCSGLRESAKVINDTYVVDLNADLADDSMARESDATFLPYIVLIAPGSFYPFQMTYDTYDGNANVDAVKNLRVLLYQVKVSIPAYRSVGEFLSFLKGNGTRVQLECGL